MPDVLEVYEMVTKQKPPEPGALERQQKRQVRTARNRKIGALAVAAAVGLVAVVVLFVATRGGPSTTTDTNQAATKPTPVEIATGFLQAFGAFDVDQAETYLADDALIHSMGADDDLRLLIDYLEGTGYEQTVGRCEDAGDSSTGTTVRCPFDFHELRSSELGLGPYTGSAFELMVRDGEIVSVSHGWAFEGNGFSDEVWEPFTAWVSKNHPKDLDVMYTDACCNVRLSEESVRLWERRTREYVEHETR